MISQLQGFRVSPQQRHLWLMQQSESTAYHARCSVLLEGDLDIDALRAAVRTVVQRHEILRTIFARTPGVKVPLQLVAEEADFHWREENGFSEGQLEEIVQDGWDYEHGPMLRLELVTLTPARHVLLVALPALCSDATGLKHLVREIVSAMDRTAAGDITQYIDLAEWQNELFESEDARTGREFWLAQNLSLPVMQRLSFERVFGYRFEPAVLTSKLDKDLTRALTGLVERRQVAISQFLLACWQVLLWRYLEQPNMIAGVGFDGRNYEELESSLGLFAKYLPLQFELDANTRFIELLNRTAKSIEQIAQWQESFTWDVIDTTPGDSSRFFPFCFDFIDLDGGFLVGDLRISILHTYACIDRFNLKLCAVRNDEDLDLEFHYDSSLFDRDDVERFAGQFVELLASAVAQPDAPVSRLNIVTETERRQLLPPITRNRETVCVHQLFEQQAESTPDAVAVEFRGQTWTYAELNARANQIAAHLRTLGAGPEKVVAIRMLRSFEMMASILGTLKTGAAYLPLDPSYPEQRLAFMIEDAKPIVVLRENLIADDIHESSNVETEVNGENLAYIIYTSGSTGEPKGVTIPHAGLTNYLKWSLERYSVTEGEGVPLHSPLTFDLTVTALFAPLLTGRKVVLVDEEHTIDALAQGDGFSFVKLTPAHLEALNQLLPAERAATYARALIVGGEALHGETLEFWKQNAPATRIINEYGPTETVVGCCISDVAAADVEAGPVSIGHSISNMEVYLLNEELQPVPVGITGEIFIGGVGLARGYLNRPDLTAERFVPSPFNSGERLYRTGDLGRYLPDGAIQFVGRRDHQVKLRGYRIELGEIESVLSSHPALTETAVVLIDDASGDKRLLAYAVADQAVTQDELRDYLKDKLPEYMVPSVVVFLDRLPLTAHGKVDRNQLPAPETIGQQGSYVAPRTPAEETLAAMWSEVLNVERVGVDDNFFDLGGHSLLATRIIARANQFFQIELPMHKLLEMPTVAGLAAVVDESLLETARVLAELEQLSEEEAEALVAARAST